MKTYLKTTGSEVPPFIKSQTTSFVRALRFRCLSIADMKNTIFLSFAFLVTRLPARPFNMRRSRFWVKIDRREKQECKQTTFETGVEIVTREYCGRIDGVPFTARYVECITDSYSVYSSFKLGSLKIAKSAVLVKSIVDAKNSSYFFLRRMIYCRKSSMPKSSITAKNGTVFLVSF